MTHKIKTYFKTTYFRSKKYLAWIRTLPCAICGEPGPSMAAHQRILGKGSANKKPPDDETLPNCNDCHMIGEHGIGIVSLYKMKRPDLWEDRNGNPWTEKTANPALGRLFSKQDLREWIGIECKKLKKRWDDEISMQRVRK